MHFIPLMFSDSFFFRFAEDMTNKPVLSDKSDPCHDELDVYTKCVGSHPRGLKENDCENEKESFRKCMKEWKAKNKS